MLADISMPDDVDDRRHVILHAQRILNGICGWSAPHRGGHKDERLRDGTNLAAHDPNKFYLLRTFGGKGHEIWEVTDPANPVKLSSIGGNYQDTHKNCGSARPALPISSRLCLAGAPSA